MSIGIDGNYYCNYCKKKVINGQQINHGGKEFHYHNKCGDKAMMIIVRMSKKGRIPWIKLSDVTGAE